MMDEKLKIKGKVVVGLQNTGYYIGERCIRMLFGEGKEMTIPEFVMEAVKKLNSTNIYSILLTSTSYTGEISWDVVLECMNYLHEHYKITISTAGTQRMPQEFFEEERTFISLSPSLSPDFDFTTFESNILRMTKRDYYNYEIIFEIGSVEEIEESLNLLSGVVAPNHLAVIYHPNATEKKKHLELVREIKEYCSTESMSPAYDVRALPRLDVILQ